jgi:hypothetical protein
VPHIVSGLEKMRQIETLDLSFNDIGPVGGTALAACLGNKHPTLSRLDVSWNKLGNKGAAAFAICLRKGTGALGELNLASNDISDSGGSVFVSSVLEAARGGLRVLRLDNNQFSTPIGRALLRAAAAASESVGGRFRMGRLGSYAMVAKQIGAAPSNTTQKDGNSNGNNGGNGGNGNTGGRNVVGGERDEEKRARERSRGGPHVSSTAGVVVGGGALRSSMSRGGVRGDSTRARDKGNVGFAEDWGFKT